MKGNIMKVSWKTRAAFYIHNRWTWVVWNNNTGNKHEAILKKANELSATRWDYGNADHNETSRCNY